MDRTDADQISELLDRHGAALVLYARTWCAAAEDAADVVQEALIAVWRQPRPLERPLAWLYRTVRNRAIDARRADRRRHNHESQAAAVRGEPWFAAPPESGLIAEEVTAALAELPVDHREVIVARLWSGMTFDEIAELTGSSSSTVHRRYAEGLASLREKLVSPCQHTNQPE